MAAMLTLLWISVVGAALASIFSESGGWGNNTLSEDVKEKADSKKGIK